MTTTREPRVGDRVRVTASRERLATICAECMFGRTGTVLQLGSRPPLFRVEADRVNAQHPDDIRWIDQCDFTLLDEAPAESAPVFKVGDRVVTSRSEPGTVKQVADGGGSYYVMRDGAVWPMWYGAEELTHAEPTPQPPTVGFDDLEVGRRYRFEGGGAGPFKVTGPKRRLDDAGPVWPVWFEGEGEGYIWDDNGRRFVHLDPEPEPAQSVRTKAETLDLMKALLPQTDRGARQVWLDVGEEARLTPEEVDLINAGYRALYEKLKESL